ncbi:NUDIX hydrolase [Arthrobacter nitrophenolicus]|jgi:8-oxo-dGTP pyrophosphatase MutT (NUDIX family)|uniref:NUDIX domain-containing protein n=1 Tax=Arthrobacter nitrophenolicus TaxID=683150 RepID=A0A4V3B0M3_9MICC|nr:NUDIX domain-containing protein [Arthrobacter nitrophenolicus]TDL33608.1 NUDIX domain-containing protein [Arthrobacter nitrophenolicus]
MPAPEYILNLRNKIGNDPLWIPGVRGVVFDDAGRVLLAQRTDNRQWALVSGILEPGEQPARGLVREIFEETAVVAEAERVVSVGAVGPFTYPNGDVCEFLDVVFRCRYVSGTARVNDDESLAVGWFALDELPELMPGHLSSIRHALAPAEAAHFEP